MNAQAATPQSAPSATKAIASSTPKELAGGNRISGTAKAGLGPIRMRPTSVAAPVAMTTGRKVRLETSGSRISSANSTPPSGVLKVAAMPAPAPAESSVIFCPVESPIACEKAEPSADADLDDRPLAADRRARADRQRRGQRLDDRDDAANVAALVVDRVHHLGDAMTLGLGREALHQIDDDEAAEDRREDHPVSEPARPLEDVGVVGDLEHAVEHGVVDEADERPQRHRADPGHDPDAQSQEAEREQIHTPFFPVVGGDSLGRNSGVSSR